VRARRMFEGMGVYTGEKMFAYLYDEEIGLKLSPLDLEEAMSIPGSAPLRPDPNSEPMREYVKMPKDVLDNFDRFCGWVQKSAAYAKSKAHH
jgi:DNA transformation protein and related proteins